MKALEILKEKLRCQSRYKGVSGMKHFIKETEEAIQELEAFKLKNALDCGKLLCLQTEVETLKTLLDRTRESEESLSLEFESLKKENTRLKKQLSKDHHIECSCSFYKPVGENNGKI